MICNQCGTDNDYEECQSCDLETAMLEILNCNKFTELEEHGFTYAEDLTEAEQKAVDYLKEYNIEFKRI